ncbi:phage tail protein [Trinickia violacea]|uniref:Phage tail protein n=1 Tax=Trinickia violacea TaxID=2571746 RepID=A0A4P8IS04_9BURK|nr:tail fiber protein [Trinickia violacea]QCP50827.1 phage tail protein [Trinickia violacea]
MSDPYLGEIRMVGFTFAPIGWALCQGQAVSVNQNQALFALLGTTYGGNGQTYFNLPDLQGRSPVGTGTGVGLSTIVPGEKAGTEEMQLTNTQLPQHTHTATSTGGAVSVTGQVSIPATTSLTGEGQLPGPTTVLGPITQGGRAGELYSTATANTNLAPFSVTSTGTGAAPNVTIGTAGLGQPFELRNPYLGLTCIIALQGIYPTRG